MPSWAVRSCSMHHLMSSHLKKKAWLPPVCSSSTSGVKSPCRPSLSNAQRSNRYFSARRGSVCRDTGSGASQLHRVLYTLSHAEEHAKEGHPECPARIHAIQRALQSNSLASMGQLQHVPSTPLTLPFVRQQLELVHPARYLDRVEQICQGLQGPAMVDDSTYICPGTLRASMETVSAALQLVDAVVKHVPAASTELAPSAYCLGRPPGHHVLPTRPMGFGVVNIISCAVKYAQQHPNIRKVSIVDFDVHHGNGTEEIFYTCPDVQYISTHQQGLWPYTGKLKQTGTGDGEGTTINLPLPGGSGHAAMQHAFERIIEPAVRRFQPDIIFVSAGYDAHLMDPLAGMQLQASTYHMMCSRLRQLACELCGGKIVLVLEGGYHIESLGEAIVQSMLGLMGLPADDGHEHARFLQPEPLRKVDALLAEAARIHGL